MRRNLLLVQGMGGSGKTTLLKHLAHWWELTGLTERSFYFGWDERAWTRAQIMRALAPKVLPADTAKAFDTMSEAAQQQAVAAALRGKRRLLILDNLESVTAAPLAIPHSLDEKQRGELRSFLAALAGGRRWCSWVRAAMRRGSPRTPSRTTSISWRDLILKQPPILPMQSCSVPVRRAGARRAHSRS
jgi:hypothetical protein